MVGGISLKANIEKDADMHIIPESKKFPQVSRFLDFSEFLGCAQLRMPIPQQFSFLGDSVNQRMAECHSLGIRKTETYSLGLGFGVWGNFVEYLFQI